MSGQQDHDSQMASSSSLAESAESARRERSMIAAQACQTCRSRYVSEHPASLGMPTVKLTRVGLLAHVQCRKSKCDEQRPKCKSILCTYHEAALTLSRLSLSSAQCRLYLSRTTPNKVSLRSVASCEHSYDQQRLMSASQKGQDNGTHP